MKRITSQTLFIQLTLFAMLLMNACKPIRDLKHSPLPYNGDNHFNWTAPVYDASKKTVFIIADNNGTEIFDMLAPFYLFNSTGKTNVFIIAKEKKPILVKKNLFVLPQLTFWEADSMKLKADVIVIPALSARTEHQDTILIAWIKNHFHANTKMLAICDGATTAAATGLYDGKPLTCHASDYEGIKIHFPKVDWVQNVNVTKSGNLYGTAGVSNAVEGALTVINDLFDSETMLAAASAVHYPRPEIKTVHQSIALSGNTKFNIARKVIFRKNKNTGILLQEGMNEFWLASIIDTYNRSFPHSFTSFCLNDSIIHTKYGLTIVSMSNANIKKLDEVHVTMPLSNAGIHPVFYKHTSIVSYDSMQTSYPIDLCLKSISEQYGSKFENVVKVLLDYN